MKLQKGFSFLELLVVIAIILVLATSSTTFYTMFLSQSTLQNAVDGVVGQVRKAQVYAMVGRESSNWGIHNGLTQIILFKGSTYGGRDVTFDETFPINPPATISGFTDIIFSRMTGTPSSMPTIIISTNIASKSVTLNNRGVITR